MLQFIVCHIYYIICAVSSFSFINVLKLFLKNVKLRTNQYVNSRLLFTDPSEFIYLIYIIQLLPGSYTHKICFYWKENLLQKRLLRSITKQYTSNLFPLYISMQKIVKVCPCHLKPKCCKIWQDLICIFCICYFE